MTTNLQNNPLEMKSGINIGWLKTIVYGAGITTVGQISSLLLAAILQLLIARNLGATKSGGIALGMSLMNFLANLSLMGLDKGVIRFFPTYKSEPGKQIYLAIFSGFIALSISLLFFMIFSLGPHLITDLFPKQALLLEALPYFLLLIPANTMISYLGAVTQALKRFDYQAFFIQFLLPVLKISALIWVIYRISNDIKTVVLGFVLSTALVVFMLCAALWKSSQPAKHVLSAQVAMGAVLVFSAPLFFITILDYGWSEAQILILGSLVSSDQIGIFNVALRLTLVLAIFQTGLGTVFAPIIAELHQASKLNELSRLLKVITRWSVIITLPVFLVTFCFAGDLMRIFGDEFVAGRPVLQVMALGILFNVAVGPIGWFIVLTGRSYLSLINSFVALVLNISVTFFLTTKFGIIGAAIAIVLGLVVINTMRLIQIKLIFGIHPFSNAIWKSLVAGCLVLLIGVGLNYVRWPSILSMSIWGNFEELVSYTVLLTSVYIAMLYFFRFDEDDRYILKNIQVRLLKFLRANKHSI
jgi:O-antigen/teichoic acid export membrane protein